MNCEITSDKQTSLYEKASKPKLKLNDLKHLNMWK